MSIKGCVLSNGERIITDLFEIKSSNNGNTLGYVICRPQNVSLTEVMPSSRNAESSNEPQIQVKFSPWMPFSKRQFFKVNPTHILTISDPEDDVKNIYQDKIETEVMDVSLMDEEVEFLFYNDASDVNQNWRNPEG